MKNKNMLKWDKQYGEVIYHWKNNQWFVVETCGDQRFDIGNLRSHKCNLKIASSILGSILKGSKVSTFGDTKPTNQSSLKSGNIN